MILKNLSPFFTPLLRSPPFLSPHLSRPVDALARPPKVPLVTNSKREYKWNLSKGGFRGAKPPYIYYVDVFRPFFYHDPLDRSFLPFSSSPLFGHFSSPLATFRTKNVLPRIHFGRFLSLFPPARTVFIPLETMPDEKRPPWKLARTVFILSATFRTVFVLFSYFSDKNRPFFHFSDEKRPP